MRASLLTAALAAAVALAACNAPPRPDAMAPLPATVTVDAGETTLDVARRYGVSMTELIAINGIQAPYEVHEGQVLRLPGAPAPTMAAAPAAIVPAPAPGTVPLAAVAPAGAGGPTPLVPSAAPTPLAPAPAAGVAGAGPVTGGVSTAGVPVAGAGGMSVEALPPPPGAVAAVAPPPTAVPPPAPAAAVAVAPTAPVATAGSGFAWPVSGTVVVAYGAPIAGKTNQGINIAAPAGTPIVAASDGIVGYAGNEVRGYGNLVLIRHDGDLVTAYAHADQLMVEKGQQVAAGETIATVGATGAVDSPQLHFEVRQASQPVDPLGYLPAP